MTVRGSIHRPSSRFNTRRELGRLAYSLLVATLLACAEVVTPDPDGPGLVPTNIGPVNLWDYDPCFTDASWVCHTGPTFFGGGFDPYGTSFNCPEGCTTVGISTRMRDKVRTLIANKIKDTGCGWAKNFLNTSLNYNRIRWYQEFDGWGDSHQATGNANATNADIHIWQGTWADDGELIVTLMHEAAHVEFDIPQSNDQEAEDRALACYDP